MILESIAAAVLISAGNYADYSTTQSALARGGIESNGIYGPSAERMAPIKVAAVALETGVFIALHKRNKTHAWIWAGTVVAANLVLAHHNNQVVRR
jgi:hypothetical protein